MMRADPFSIKPVKEIDQVPGCNDCMKRCDSCKNFVDHISSFECFATKKIKIRKYLTCTSPNMIYLAYCTQNVANKVLDRLKIGNLDFLIINRT